MDERERKTADAEQRGPDVSEFRKRTQAPGPVARRPEKSNSQRHTKREKRRASGTAWFFLLGILLVLSLIAGFLYWERYGPSKERANLKKYYGIENSDDLAVIVGDQAIGNIKGKSAGGKIFEDVPYVEYSVLRDYINSWFYWDPNENVLLYTLPTGTVSAEVGKREYTGLQGKKLENYVILKAEGKTAYVALPFVQQFTNMNYRVFESTQSEIPARAVIECDFGEHKFAVLKRNTQVRYQGGVKSPVMTEVKKSDTVRILEDEDDWMKVATEDGFIGYVKTSSLKRPEMRVTSGDFVEPNYTSISLGRTVNMVWHSVYSEAANEYILETIAGTKGLTTIAPTWFSIADTQGNIDSLADKNYVEYAHQSNLQVWAVLRDFDGGINSFEETYEVLSYTSKRKNLIGQVLGQALQTGIDGINLDFELISEECGEHFIQFVRELSVKCRQNGLIFSINDYVPMPYNRHYRLSEQAKTADYIIIMGYDEHNGSSLEAGPVGSYPYIAKGLSDALREVPNSKLINGIAFYTRLWHETPKTEEELENQAGTEEGNYKFHVTNTPMGMDEARQYVESMGAEIVWDEQARQNYAEWESEDGIYKIWLEDEQSIEEKLKLIRKYWLAGVASWRLGWEKPEIWDLILQYVN